MVRTNFDKITILIEPKDKKFLQAKAKSLHMAVGTYVRFMLLTNNELRTTNDELRNSTRLAVRPNE